MGNNSKLYKFCCIGWKNQLSIGLISCHIFYRQTQRAIGNNSVFKVPVRPVIELEALNVMPWDSLLFL